MFCVPYSMPPTPPPSISFVKPVFQAGRPSSRSRPTRWLSFPSVKLRSPFSLALSVDKRMAGRNYIVSRRFCRDKSQFEKKGRFATWHLRRSRQDRDTVHPCCLLHVCEVHPRPHPAPWAKRVAEARGCVSRVHPSRREGCTASFGGDATNSTIDRFRRAGSWRAVSSIRSILRLRCVVTPAFGVAAPAGSEADRRPVQNPLRADPRLN